MITVSPLLRFMCLFSMPADFDGPECAKLVKDFYGAVRDCRPICFTVERPGNYVHINITKSRGLGSLYIYGLICDSESTKNKIFDVEYVDSKFHLTRIAPNETCPLDNVGVMRLLFKSGSSVNVSIKVNENYENETNGTSNDLTKKTGKQDKDEMKTSTAMIPQLTISDNTTEVWEQNIKEMNTTIAMLSEANTSKHTTELTILIVTVCGVVFLLLTVFLCVYKFVDYKFKKRLLAREIQLKNLRHNQISQGIELSVLNENDPDHSANREPSDLSEDAKFELGFHSP